MGVARIVRIDVSDERIVNIAGIRIGDSKAKIMARYPGRIVERPNLSGRDKELIFVPKDKADQKYRYLFSMKEGRIRSFRSGLQGAVEMPEGCL